MEVMEQEQTKEIKFQKIRIGITHGDINGISYEVILKAFKDERMLDFFIPIIYGSPKVAAYYKKVLKLSQVQLNHIKSADKAEENVINIVNCIDPNVRVEIGRPTEISGKAAIDALKQAVEDIKKGLLDAIVTAPISKEAVATQNFEFKGHTWFFAKEFGAEDVLMLMVYEDLRIAVATDHIPVKDVSSALSKELIVSKLKILNESLKTDFAIERPILAVLALNPHAGDGGLIGNEEQEIIIPAIEQAKEEGLIVMGPYPADGFFGSENYKNFDGILAMYHDQGMLPFKILSMGKGVNYTAGLPIIRTSPAHGTAYDIAGLNQADPTSFINAMFLARTIYKNRKLFEGIEPLQKQDMEELLPTLKPAVSAELQAVDELQQEDAQDEVKQIHITTSPEQLKQQSQTSQQLLEVGTETTETDISETQDQILQTETQTHADIETEAQPELEETEQTSQEEIEEHFVFPPEIPETEEVFRLEQEDNDIEAFDVDEVAEITETATTETLTDNLNQETTTNTEQPAEPQSAEPTEPQQEQIAPKQSESKETSTDISHTSQSEQQPKKQFNSKKTKKKQFNNRRQSTKRPLYQRPSREEFTEYT